MDQELTENLLAILRDPRPGDALMDALARQKLSELPFLQDAAKIPAGPIEYHSGSVLLHLARCMNEVAGDPLAVWMALCHDAGKLTSPKAMWPHHYGHEIRGIEVVKAWTEKLALPQGYREAGCLSSKLHMRVPKYFVMRPGKRLKLLRKIFSSDFTSQLLRVVDADSHSHVSAILIADWSKLAENPQMEEQEQIRLLMQLHKRHL